MKQLRKKIVAVICVVAMFVGIVVPNGLTINTKAADTATQSTSKETADSTVREWWVYGDDDADTGLVLTGSGSRKSISDAGVNLPEGLIEANLSLQIKLNVSATDDVISALNSVNAATFELANEINDAGELSWTYGGLQSGENNLTFLFKNAAHTNGSAVNGTAVQDGKSPFDWEETIDFFGLYLEGYSTDAAALSITVESVKIVYTDAGLTFGADDTYLQLDSAMSATPNAVEATVNMDEIDNREKWTLHAGTNFSGVSMSVGSYTTTGSDAPGVGMECFTLDATSAAITGFEALQHSLAIDASAYTMDKLAIGFWVYSSTAGTLATGYDNGQIRLSSNTDNMSGNCLFYYMYEISVNAGWTYVEIPLSSMKTDIIGTFSLNNINTWGIAAGYQVPQGRTIYFGAFELVALESGNSSEEEEEIGWTLHSGSTFSGVSMSVGSYTTTASDAPGEGMTCFALDASSSEISGFEALQTNLGINASAYDMSDLTFAFWVYSNKDTTLGADWNPHIRISSNADNVSSNCLFYYMYEINVKTGWNYVEIPLSKMKTDIIGNFSVGNINTWGITSYAVPQGTQFYFGDMMLLPPEETVDTGEWTLHAGTRFSGVSMSVGSYTTTANDAPGAGMNCFTLDASSAAISGFEAVQTNLGIDASAHNINDLSVAFWVYSNKDTTLGADWNPHIRISSNADNVSSNCLFYYMYEITVSTGWNYIEIPLNKMKTDIIGDFSISNINTWGITSFGVPQGTKFYFGDIKLVDPNFQASYDEGDITVTTNVTSSSDNYMIFSNANAAGEANPFALYVTKEGYPAVLYGTTQFVLNQRVDTGADVNVKAVINASRQVEFYIDGSHVATSETTVSSVGAPITSYCIGADGTGDQTFVGTIKDVKTYSDASASTCTGNWLLIGDIRYVVETMPDASGNGNNATFKGTRANDWYDIEAIGEDDWSLVFIPDIVQRFYAGEHATWHKMASWIGNNVEKENIKYVMGAKTADTAQADAMNYGYEFFDSVVPTTNFNTATDNSYYRFSVNGVKWMILSLKTGWDADATAVFTWGKDIIAQYPYDNIIITCDNYYNSIWSEFHSENVKLIVYGSQGGAPTEDAPVMNFPAQNDLENNYFGEQGLGLMYMLRFTDGGTKVTARSYAPIYDSYFTGVVNYEKAIETEVAPEVEIKKYEGATPGVAPTDVPTGMLFAGWFKPGQAQEWLLSPENGNDFSGQSFATDKYTTTESDEPGTGMTCFVLSESSTASANFEALQTFLGVDASAYSMDELALGFWVCSNVAGVLDDPNDTNWAHLRISSNDDNVSGNCLFYYMQNISVNAGWNYIEIPLSSFEDDIIGDFSLTNIDTFGITSYKVPSGMELKFGNFELIAYGAGSSKESALKEATTGTAYARFVDKDLLTVKAQIKASTSDQSNYSDIRFVTSVDRLEYKRMGFEISYEKDNGSIKEIKGGATENNIVYQKLYVVGANGGEPEGYTPKEIISANSVYFKAYTITNVPNRAFDRDFKVRAYWVTMDGTKVYGDYVDKSVWMGYQTKGEFLPVIVNTTYETDDVVIADVVLNDPKYGYVTAADVANADYDWSTALQNALTDVHNKGGGTVYVPAGQYKLTKSITIPSDVTLRGDWQDPDVGTEYGTIFNIYPTQEITAYRNVDAAHNQNTAAFVMTGSSGVVGVTAYYPNQSIADGSAVPYPYTFYVTVGNDGGQLITLKNITVINGYRGVGTRYEMQHEALIIDNFKGTFLDCGMAIYNSSDTGTISNVSISSKYWKKCSLGAVDAGAYVLANTTAIELGDLEWHQLSNCSIEKSYIGVSIVPGYRANFSGSMIDMNITGCATGITIADEIDEKYYGDKSFDLVGSSSGADGTPDKEQYPLVKALDPRWGLVIARSIIEGSTNAIVNEGAATEGNSWLIGTNVNQTPGLIRMTDVSVNGNIVKNTYTKDSAWADTDYNVQSSAEDIGTVGDATAQYDATYTITEAQKKNLWVVEGIQAYDGANVDVSELINAAMDKVLERNANGGIVYVPGGTYRLDNPITVPAGVELHGASSVANREQYMDGEGTLFMVYYGDDDSNTATDTALVTLAGDNSGISGVRFLYPENISTYAEEAAGQTFSSTYTIAANGASNVHVTNCFIATSSYGVNLQNCNDFHVENLFTCVYRNTINVADSTGVIRGAWTNPNAIARTTAKGLTANWPEEAVYNNSTAPINIIRNYLKDNLTFIQVSGSNSDILIHNTTAYAHNKTVAQSGGNVLVMNSNADSLDHENGVQFTLSGGIMKAINALRAAITDTGSSQDADTRFLYNHTGGTLAIYNSMMAKSTEKNSAWENNYNTTK